MLFLFLWWGGDLFFEVGFLDTLQCYGGILMAVFFFFRGGGGDDFCLMFVLGGVKLGLRWKFFL